MFIVGAIWDYRVYANFVESDEIHRVYDFYNSDRNELYSSDPWSTSEFLSTPIFSKIMSRTRFQLILKFLHFNNNNDPNYDVNDENRDRLHKVRPLIELIRDSCKNVYCPGQNHSVDKSLVLFKGRLHFKQYIRTKRARFGIKLYELTTSNGITLDF